MQFVTRLLGAPQMSARLNDIAAKFPAVVGAGIYQEAQIEMTEAKKRCPVGPVGAKRRKGEIPGRLRASGTVTSPLNVRGEISVILSFGGPGIDYAVAVHEHLSEHSPPSWVAAEESGAGIHWNVPGTGPKFLESVLNESRPHMAARLGARINFNKVA